MNVELYLAPIFAVVAFLYAVIGFGGGSTYSALLVLYDFNFAIIPIVTLTCNLVVVTGGLLHYSKAGCFKPSLVLPFVVLSVPMAYLGGTLHISEAAFMLLLGWCLLCSGVMMLVKTSRRKYPIRRSAHRWLIGAPVGAILGLIAGITGIGGGIFLAPIMTLMAWSDQRTIASSASFFIFVNSLSGLSAHILKADYMLDSNQYLAFAALPIAVAIGGQVGSYLSARIVSENLIRNLTAALVLYAGFRILVF